MSVTVCSDEQDHDAVKNRQISDDAKNGLLLRAFHMSCAHERGGAAEFSVSPRSGHLCGGFTTFSSFSLQSMELLQAGENLQAALYIVSSVAICLASVFLGYWLATRLGLPPHTEV